MLTLSEINIYPVKSAKGITLTAGELEPRGLKHDRRWMVVDAAGTFVSQRTAPRMALVSVKLQPRELMLTAPSMQPLRVPLLSPPQPTRTVRVWNDLVQAVDLGDEAAAWFSDFLRVEARFVHQPDTSVRRVNPKYARADEQVSFADAFPLLLISQASLDDLIARLERPVPMNRFRPNLVVSGSEPYEEDAWRRIRIGSVAFRIAKPCSRCATTTVDQLTGEVGKEPLRTLASYRSRQGKVMFGQNLIHAATGTVAIGEAVEILE